GHEGVAEGHVFAVGVGVHGVARDEGAAGGDDGGGGGQDTAAHGELHGVPLRSAVVLPNAFRRRGAAPGSFTGYPGFASWPPRCAFPGALRHGIVISTLYNSFCWVESTSAGRGRF